MSIMIALSIIELSYCIPYTNTCSIIMMSFQDHIGETGAKEEHVTFPHDC